MADDRASGLTEAALSQAGLEDVRPALRRLLVQLKQKDPPAFEEASRRYREELEPAVCRGDDPVVAWLAYGTWLAGRLSDGRSMAIDASGRARPFDPPIDATTGDLVIHIPADGRAPALLLAAPSRMSDPQRETAALLVG